MAPLAVYDVHDDGYLGLTQEQQEQIMGWLREQDQNPDVIYRVEIYLIDCPSARIFVWDIDADGRHYCPLDHAHRAWTIQSPTDDPAKVCEIASRTFEVPISQMPPVKPWRRP